MHLGVILPKSQPGQDILQGFGQVVPVRFGRFRNEPDPVFFRLALAVGPDEGQFQGDRPRQGPGRLIRFQQGQVIADDQFQFFRVRQFGVFPDVDDFLFWCVFVGGTIGSMMVIGLFMTLSSSFLFPGPGIPCQSPV